MSGQVFQAYASAAFGMEGLVAAELRRLGMKDVKAGSGGVRFSADLRGLFLCNLRLRFCDRVFILMAEGRCLSFDELFRLVNGQPWEKFMSGTEAVNVSCRCARSRLMSQRDCQSISKKAVLERLKSSTGRTVFPENGPPFPIHISVHADTVMVLLNVSGPSLSRRGYRTWNGEAPLRETLASALVELSPWRPGMPLYDPCCGTGTILIEAAFREAHRAPGLSRPFALEEFSFADRKLFDAVRGEESSQADVSKIYSIGGSDSDPSAIELASRHVRQAGLDGHVSLSVLPLQELNLTEEKGVFICNPPYGERLGTLEQSRALCRDLRALSGRHPSWSFCAVSSDPAFERYFGRRADRKRRLYNGTIECVFYVFE